MPHRRLILAAAMLSLLAGCATSSGPATVADTLARNPDLSTLAGLMRDAGLADALAGAGPVTVFAPTNDAFKAVPAKTLEDLRKDPARLKAVLSYHVLPARVTAAGVSNASVKTLQGSTLAISRAGTFVTVEDAMVQNADMVATNGVVHTIDRVLVPAR